MDKEQFINLHKKFKGAYKNYRDYVEQFLTRTFNNVVIKEATKFLNRTDPEKIRELRKKAEDAEHELDEFLSSI